ncbi:MAG: T9SS type A sorting domain-containing protein [Bacteroidetes bacterium]|nr:T9SS type A sorting domain-containing protein [Bacteroidota bacterium]
MKVQIAFFTLLIFLISSEAFSSGKGNQDSKKTKSSAAFVHHNSLETPAFKMFFKNDGNIQDPTGNRSIEYPKGSGKSPLYAGGFAISGYVNDSLRTSWMATPSRISEWQPGSILPDGSPALSSDPRFRVYKLSVGDIYGGNQDFAEWPVPFGAEFNDLNKNGIYEPNLGDTPGFWGSQMIWYVINDLPVSRTLGTKGMGLEVQVSGFFFSDWNSKIDHTVFLVYKLINKGKNPIKDAIFSLHSDPDVGFPTDDLVGVDSVRSFAYAYNEKPTDQFYGVSPPAFGFGFFLGPKYFTGNLSDTLTILGKKYPGYKSVEMKSFVKYSGDRPDLADPNTAEEARFYQEGLKSNGTEISPLTEGIGGVISDNPRIFHPGFPESSSGWRDKVGNDRRMMINSGKFNMMPGDTQIIITGYIVGQGQTNLESIGVLRTIADSAKMAYSNLVSLKPGTPKTGKLTVVAVDQSGKPLNNSAVSIGFNSQEFSGKLNHNFENGPFSAVLYEGSYKLRIIGYANEWGFPPDTVIKDFTISANGETQIQEKLIRTASYTDRFDGTFTKQWKMGADWDTTVAPGFAFPWKITTGIGILEWSSNVLKGKFSTGTSVNLNYYSYPVLSFLTSYRMTGTGDTLFVYGSGDNGKSWVKIDFFQKDVKATYVKKSYDLDLFFDITDSVKIRFVVVKNSTATAFAKIDDFHIVHNGYTSVPGSNSKENGFQLLPPYPNPFNPSTSIRWIQPFGGEATISVMNLLGQEVKVISAGARVSGQNEQVISFSGLSSGIYFYRIDLNGKSSPTGKLMFLK